MTDTAAPRCPFFWNTHDQRCTLTEGHSGSHAYGNLPPATPAASAPRGEDALLDRLTGLMVGGCTCMTKTPELAHHDPQCKYRVASEAYDTIAAQAREIAELRHDIERAQEASTALATELEAARAGAPQSSAEHFQREGILPDIIREALDAYDDFMGDDDYRGMAVLREIMDRMRKRFTPFDAAREAKP